MKFSQTLVIILSWTSYTLFARLEFGHLVNSLALFSYFTSSLGSILLSDGPVSLYILHRFLFGRKIKKIQTF